MVMTPSNRYRWLCAAALLTLLIQGCSPRSSPSEPQVRAIAKEAYTYAYPMVDGYRILHAYFINPESPEYKGTWNRVHSVARVYTPADKAVQTPNSDTPYSMAGLDLRAEPIVLTIPPIEENRYFSVQFVDLYTHNFDYLGSRTSGNGGGRFLVAGPGWKGETPKGIQRVITAETELVLAIIRTQLFRPQDLENVRKIQAAYSLQPLSAFLGQPAPPAAPALSFPVPPKPQEMQNSLRVLELMTFLKPLCPTHSSEKDLFARFAQIGLGETPSFQIATLSPETRSALQQGIADAWTDMAGLQKQVDAHVITSANLFGTRGELRNNYLYRMAGARLGIYANSQAEAIYPAYLIDSAGQKLDGSNRYTIRFAPGQLPPVNAFWSLTMYGLPDSLLVANPIDRYLINSPMLPGLKKDPDGGITLYLQNTSPGPALETNWLPAPPGPFMAILRLYWPKPEALNGKWKQPPLQKVE